MAMNKIERIDREIQKTREKITEYQNKLKGLEAQKTEAENLQIVQLVRAMKLTPQELNAMLSHRPQRKRPTQPTTAALSMRNRNPKRNPSRQKGTPPL